MALAGRVAGAGAMAGGDVAPVAQCLAGPRRQPPAKEPNGGVATAALEGLGKGARSQRGGCRLRSSSPYAMRGGGRRKGRGRVEKTEIIQSSFTP